MIHSKYQAKWNYDAIRDLLQSLNDVTRRLHLSFMSNLYKAPPWYGMWRDAHWSRPRWAFLRASQVEDDFMSTIGSLLYVFI